MDKKCRFVFIVQGEGRGHLTQAISLAGILRRNGHEIVEVLVGKSRSRELPSFFAEKIQAPIRTYEAPSFIFKRDKKHIDLAKTILYNISPAKLRRYGKNIEFIHKQVKDLNPDIVINFYELLPGFMHLRFRMSIPFVNVGHQFLIRHHDYAHGKGEAQSLMFLRLHALLTNIGATKTLGLSFYPLKISPREGLVTVPALLREEVLKLEPTKGDYILGYMLNQGYEDEVHAWHKAHPDVKLHFFWDKKDAPKELKVDENFTLHKIDDEKFIHYMKDCKGYITTAGFESVCEAMYLDKPVMMIPAHIEQEINAADAASINGGIIGEKFDLSVLLEYMAQPRNFDEVSFQKWIRSAEEIFLREILGVLDEE